MILLFSLTPLKSCWLLDRWSLPILWHLSNISATCNLWSQLQILGGQLTPLSVTRPSRAAAEYKIAQFCTAGWGLVSAYIHCRVRLFLWEIPQSVVPTVIWRGRFITPYTSAVWWRSRRRRVVREWYNMTYAIVNSADTYSCTVTSRSTLWSDIYISSAHVAMLPWQRKVLKTAQQQVNFSGNRGHVTV